MAKAGKSLRDLRVTKATRPGTAIENRKVIRHRARRALSFKYAEE